MLGLLIGIILFHFILEQFLSLLNIRAMKPSLPENIGAIYEEERYARSQRYSKDHARLDLISSTLSTAITIGLFLSGFFGWLDNWARSLTESPVLLSMIFFGILGFCSDVIGIPFQLYGQFVIEKKYEFNRMTARLFIFDKLKSWMLSLIIGAPVLALIVLFYTKTGVNFWWITWIFITLFSLVITFFYSSWIVPLFNKQTPLSEGTLRDLLEQFAHKAGFALKNIYVIDGSKRSTKANAYFTGFGKKKRVVLYDTLINDLSEEEIVAVLAHEIGHYKLHHIWTGMIASVAQTGLMLFLLSLLIDHEGLAMSVGAGQTSFHIGALVFAVLYSPVSILTGILMKIISRANEYKADGFAASYGWAGYLQSGLITLSKKNLSNLTPHPAYVFVYYSHPTLLNRIAKLKGDLK